MTKFEKILLVVAIVSGFLILSHVAESKETTTLDEALERPVKVQRFVDKELGVVCYWVQRYPKYLTCVEVDDDSRD